ncbi:transcription termination factor MTERF6, chloroplastic/mitochondrial-like [Aristolochia californica]|uniref:transcription termination factor MTERF6, chloroplastic/mitochondrial-like n=1 Tax=Aristolochia californica TaxID=171875 RepID=UPI0035DAAF7C
MQRLSDSLPRTLKSLASISHYLPFSTVVEENASLKAPFIVDYLVKSCGFSREKAIAASTAISHIKTPKKPDSVLSFLRNYGLSDTHIRILVSRRPRLLCSNVAKTLEPKLKIFQDLGFSGADILQIIQNPNLFHFDVETHLKPRVEFLRRILSSDEEVVRTLKRITWVLSGKTDPFEERTLSNISVMKEYGISDEKIRKLIMVNPQYFLSPRHRLQKAIVRVENEFGISRCSGMFFHAVIVLCSISETTLEYKFQILESLGWSESDKMTMFRVLPYSLGLSEAKLRKGLKFLMQDAGYEASYIACRPKLLMYNLETRIAPRHALWNGLLSRNLLETKIDFHTVVCWSEKRVLEEFVEKFKEMAPDVCEAYKSSVEAGETQKTGGWRRWGDATLVPLLLRCIVFHGTIFP